MPLEILELAQYIINKCVLEKKPINRLQLQKILYLIQCYWIDNHDTFLFNGSLDAFEFGPKFFEVERVYCGYGVGDILSSYDVMIDKNITDEIDSIIEEERDHCIWEVDDRLTGEGTPWKITRDKLKERAKERIVGSHIVWEQSKIVPISNILWIETRKKLREQRAKEVKEFEQKNSSWLNWIKSRFIENEKIVKK